ncbi:MAG: arginine--tRNA ligase [Phycisphaerales bacterium]
MSTASPTSSLNPAAALRERFQRAADEAFAGVQGGGLPAVVITPSGNPAFGDYQCNSAMPFAKALGKPPRAVAMELIAKVQADDLCEPLTEKSVAGPGFINITLKKSAIAAVLDALNTPELGIQIDANAPKTVVDLCGVNLAKQMHIGHLRSTVIGDAIARTLARLYGPEKIVRQNHVGDWGLPIAMVTAYLMQLEKAGKVDLSTITLDQLDRIYKDAKKTCDTCDDDIEYVKAWGSGPKVLAELEAANDAPAAALAEAKSTLVRLQQGDKEVRRVWQRIYDVTMAACLATCKRLNSIVLPEHSAGESFYEHMLAPLVADLQKRGVAEESDGALVVRLDEFGIAEPVIIRKRDGAFIYATADLAGVQYRAGTLKAKRVVYCVDARQSLHFKQVFAASKKAGLCPQDEQLEHAAFGTILGEDGKPFKSRSGDSVKLNEVIDEAEQAALAEVVSRYPDLPAEKQRSMAATIAVAAIRYTDLSTERIKDYVFSFQRMVKAEGDTGPYLLYAYARTRSLAAKAVDTGAKPGAFAIEHPSEKALALLLLRYPEAVASVGATLEPSRLCAHLYDVANAYAKFFNDCPVLISPEPTRGARLALSDLTSRVLADGLTLLGVPLLERM